jgi:hypothetical protein
VFQFRIIIFVTIPMKFGWQNSKLPDKLLLDPLRCLNVKVMSEFGYRVTASRRTDPDQCLHRQSRLGAQSLLTGWSCGRPVKSSQVKSSQASHKPDVSYSFRNSSLSYKLCWRRLGFCPHVVSCVEIRPLPLPFKSLPIHNLLITQSFNTIYSSICH